jgi:hypothetical protein
MSTSRARAVVEALPEPVEPMPEPVPGLAKARAAVLDLREVELGLTLDIQRAEHDRREAEARRRRLMSAVSRGEDIDPSAIAEADAQIAEAEARIAMKQEALPEAGAATKRAERLVAAVLREELRRRAPLLRAAAAEAERRWLAAQREFNDLDVLASEVQRAAANSATDAATLEAMLERSARFASTAPEKAAV